MAFWEKAKKRQSAQDKKLEQQKKRVIEINISFRCFNHFLNSKLPPKKTLFNINMGGGEKTVPLAEVACVHAELRSLMFETFQTKYWSGIKAHTCILTQNHKLGLSQVHRASHISKVSLEHSTASPSACYMKENTVVSHNMLLSPFTEPNFKEG